MTGYVVLAFATHMIAPLRVLPHPSNIFFSLISVVHATHPPYDSAGAPRLSPSLPPAACATTRAPETRRRPAVVSTRSLLTISTSKREKPFQKTPRRRETSRCKSDFSGQKNSGGLTKWIMTCLVQVMMHYVCRVSFPCSNKSVCL